MINCDLRFSLPGFRTESFSLADSRYLDNPDIGTIILRHRQRRRPDGECDFSARAQGRKESFPERYGSV